MMSVMIVMVVMVVMVAMIVKTGILRAQAAQELVLHALAPRGYHCYIEASEFILALHELLIVDTHGRNVVQISSSLLLLLLQLLLLLCSLCDI